MVIRLHGAYLGDSSTEVGAHEELEAFELGLDDYETEICLRIHVSGLLFDKLNLEYTNSISNILRSDQIRVVGLSGTGSKALCQI